MARTSKSRGKTNFKLDNSPYPILKGLRSAAKNLFNKTPAGKIGGALGIGGGGEGGSLGERLDRIEQKLDQENTGVGSAVLGGNNVDPAELAAGKAQKLGAMGGEDEQEMLEKEVQ